MEEIICLGLKARVPDGRAKTWQWKQETKASYLETDSVTFKLPRPGPSDPPPNSTITWRPNVQNAQDYGGAFIIDTTTDMLWFKAWFLPLMNQTLFHY